MTLKCDDNEDDDDDDDNNNNDDDDDDNDNNNDNNNNRIEKRNSAHCAANCPQRACNKCGTWDEGTAQLLSLTEFT